MCLNQFRNSPFFVTRGVWVFSQYFCMQHHSGFYIMQETLYLDKTILVSIWLTVALIQVINRAYECFLIVTYPTNVNVCLVLQS